MGEVVQRSFGYFVTLRAAKTAKTCARCGRRIEPGDRYADHGAAPWYDFGVPGRWVHTPTCERSNCDRWAV